MTTQTTQTTPTITETSTVTVRRRNSKGQMKVHTGPVDPRYLPDETGDMFIIVRGRMQICNVRDVIAVSEA